MKKILKSFACVLVIMLGGMNPSANAMCGFGWISITPPTPTCSCPSNRVAIKRILNTICQEEKCVSTGASAHYLNQGWVYGCCAVERLDESKDESGISVYPNPATDKLTVFYLGHSFEKMEIYNALGQQVFSQSLSGSPPQLTIDISAWNRGMYFVKLSTSAMARKIIVE